MLRKLAVVAVIVGTAPVGAWASTGSDPLMLSATSAAADSHTPTFLDQFFAQATVDPAGPETQPDTGTPPTATPPEHYTESSGTTVETSNEEEPWGPHTGNWEFTLTGTGIANSNVGYGQYGVTGSIGYYFTRNLELSLRQTGDFSTNPNGGDWGGSTVGAIDFNIPIGRFVPFVGINGGMTYAEKQNVVAVAGGEGGLKFYVYPKTFVFGMFGYQWPTNFSFLHTGNFDFSLGVGFNF